MQATPGRKVDVLPDVSSAFYEQRFADASPKRTRFELEYFLLPLIRSCEADKDTT